MNINISSEEMETLKEKVIEKGETRGKIQMTSSNLNF